MEPLSDGRAEGVGWPEYPTLLPNGTWIGGCTFPNFRDDGRCGARCVPGTDGCTKHRRWALLYDKYIGPIERALGRLLG